MIEGCVEWHMSSGSHGYGQKWNGETVTTAHRYVWEQEHGPLPEGMVIDHLCRNKKCVNLDHLEAVTHGENIRRGYAVKPEPAVCKNGLHDMTAPKAWAMTNKGRTCRECLNASRRRYRSRSTS